MGYAMMYVTVLLLLPIIVSGRSTVSKDDLVDDLVNDFVDDVIESSPKDSMDAKNDEYEVQVAKKAIQTKQVEGCYKSQTDSWMWAHTGTRYNFGSQNSNHKCQEKCRSVAKILSAVRGSWCYCGNIFPKGLKVADSQCNTRCVSWTQCYGPQECCGGSEAFSLSVVGDIDVARDILERLRSKWNGIADYRNSILNKVKGSFPTTYKAADWWGSFDRGGWSDCPKKDNNYLYLHGLYRSGGTSGLHLLEQGDCRESFFRGKGKQTCYDADWVSSFDHKGWSTCKSGYFMSGINRSGDMDNDQLYRLERARCCQPPAVKWGHCINLNVWSKFDHQGWTDCPKDYYLTGLYRNTCNSLHCIEEFKCCKMETEPVFSIVVKDLKKGYTKKCSMTVGGSYSCDRVNEEPRLSLKTKKFEVEDRSPLNVAKPEPIPNFKPKICTASRIAYTCKMSRSVAVTKSSKFSIGTGFSMGYSMTAGAEVGYSGFGASAKTSFSSTLSMSASFNAGFEKSESEKITDQVSVSVNVPTGTEVTIDVKRVKQDLIYFWKGHFEIIGRYTVSYGGNSVQEDVTRILAGNDRKFYSFGKWEYPGTDFHRVIITDKYGNEKEKDCKQLEGDKKSSGCEADL